jgi:hypothetical protein
MSRFHKTLLALIATCAVLMAGCAATPEASREDDAQAKRFESAPGAAIVYLYRADTPARGISTLWLDGRLVGESLPATYFRTSVRPGKNLLSAYAGDPGRLEFETRSGEVYFVAITVLADDALGSSRFRVVTRETGIAQINRCCTLLQTWKPGQNRIPL